MNDGAALAEKVTQFRKAKGWNQPQLARASGLSYQHIRRLEAGEVKHPGSDTLLLLANALDVPVTELMESASDATPIVAGSQEELIRKLVFTYAPDADPFLTIELIRRALLLKGNKLAMVESLVRELAPEDEPKEM